MLEDDEGISGLVKFALEREGIVCRVFSRVKDFYDGLREEIPAVAVLDVMLPDGNGFDVLQEVKHLYADVCCIMLSALGKETDKVKGLDLGADDYIAKPFGVMEFVARINAALRRQKETNVLVVGGLELNCGTMSTTLNGKPLELNKKEFELLKYCMKNVGIVLTRETLLTQIWGYVDAETRTLDNHIARLRKLGIDNFETVFGVGYRFIAK